MKREKWTAQTLPFLLLSDYDWRSVGVYGAAILSALPDNYRRILELRFLDSCSVGEAATAMGISTANAKVLQHRALRRAAQVAQEVSP